MNEVLSKEDILSLNNDEISKLKGKNVEIKRNNEVIINSKILTIICASNEPHLPCGFLLSNNTEIGFGSIKEMLIIN